MVEKNPFDVFSGLDLESMMKQFEIPGVDTSSMVASQKRNMEAITEANRVAAEGMQALAKRQMEFAQQAFDEIRQAYQGSGAVASPQEAAQKQGELVQESFGKAVTNLREMAEMVAKSNSEAFEVVNQRMNESMEEFKSLLKPGSGS